MKRNDVKFVLVTILCASIVVVGVFYFIGAFEVPLKQRLIYDDFVSTVTKTGLTTNALDLFPGSHFCCTATNQIGVYDFTIYTKNFLVLKYTVKNAEVVYPYSINYIYLILVMILAVLIITFFTFVVNEIITTIAKRSAKK